LSDYHRNLVVFFVATLAVGLAGVFLYFFDRIRNIPPLVKTVVTDSEDENAIKILFVGNSFTFANMLPAVLAEFIKDGLHKPTKIYQVCVPGQTFEGHWATGAAQRMIADRGPWDYVVLQGASYEPAERRSKLYEYAERFDALIKQAHAKTILFETWADKADRQTQETIREAYDTLGKQIGAAVIPVGDSFFDCQQSNLQLYYFDNHHPSQSGTYLAACTFYSYLFGQDPHGSPSSIKFHDIDTGKDHELIELDAKQAKELQDVAWHHYSVSAK
jgi:hypothetical protein